MSAVARSRSVPDVDATHWQGGAVHTFKTFDAYESILNRTMRRYNFAWYDATTGEHYGDAVVRYSRRFWPEPSGTVFP